MSSINFDNIYLLLIAVPLVVLLVAPYVLAVGKENRNGHNIASMVMHVLIALMIAFAAAGTKIVTVVTETDIYVVADVSYSANRNLDAVDGYIYDLSRNLPGYSRMGVICFGKDYTLLTRLGGSLKSVREADVDDSSTDIVSALDYAGSLFRDNVIKRIVLITDGKETGSADSGALRRKIDALTSDGIRVDAIYLDDNITDSIKEVQVTDVEFTANAYLNSEVTFNAVISSSCTSNATVSLRLDGETISKKAVTLTAGSNSVSFTLTASEQGSFDYEITAEAEEDTNPYNNSFYFTQNVTGEVKVLFITGSESDGAAAEELFGSVADVTLCVNTTVVPSTVEELCKYDEIVLSNVDATTLNNYTLFLESLDTVVSLFGKSLITIGDTGIQNKQDNELKALSDMLPVSFGNSNRDKKLYTIVIDGSRSMETNSKLLNAKAAALSIIDSLNVDDSVCVVTFYGNVEVAVAPSVIGSNRESIKQKINDIDVLQGTYIGLGMKEALNQIYRLTDYGDKQLILISDGLSYTNESDDPVEIADELRAYGVITSVYDVGRGADNGTASQNALALLKNIAQVGGGSYYSSLEEIDGTALGGLLDQTNEYIIERDSYVTIKRPRDEALEGIDNALYISGYVNSTAKASATTALTTEYQTANGSSITVPVYAYRSYGNGKVATFTGGISGGWISAWAEAGLDKLFFGNVISANTPNEKTDHPFTLTVENDSGRATVTIAPATVRSDASATIALISPDGSEIAADMVFNSMTYGYTFTTPDAGRYVLTVEYTYGDNVYAADGSFTLSYLPEYDSFATFDASVLNSALGSSGTVSEDGTLSLENDEKDIGTMTVALTVPLLIACVALYAVDIIVRKLKWNDIKSLFKKVSG